MKGNVGISAILYQRRDMVSGKIQVRGTSRVLKALGMVVKDGVSDVPQPCCRLNERQYLIGAF